MGDKTSFSKVGEVVSVRGNVRMMVLNPCRKWGGRLVILWLACVIFLAPAVEAADNVSGKGERVLRTTLKNGLQVVIVRSPLAPAVTTVVNYQVGSNEAPEGFPGMAHAQEHMMFRGSLGLSADQLASISAAMGGRFDADTQQTVTQYFFTVPSEDLDVALRIEAIRMQSTLDDQTLWEKERGAIEQEVAQDLSNPEYIFYTKLLEKMFKGTPYAHDPLGSRPSFDKTTGERLKNFYDSWYAPNNAILIVVGDLEPRKALREVRHLFENIPAKKLPKRPEIHFESVETESLNLNTDLPYGVAVVSFRMPGSDNPDFAAAKILADILSSQRASLYALVPEGKALSADFSLNDLPKASLSFAEAAFPKGGDGKALVNEIKNIISEVIKNGVPADLVEAAKRHELADAEFKKNSISGLAMAWSQTVAVEGRQSPDEDIEAIKQVSPGDVNRVAREYLDLTHAVDAILTPQSSGQPISSQSFGGRESFAPGEVYSVELPHWAMQAVTRAPIPASTLHPVEMTLPNGLKLIVQNEAISDTVSVFGHIKNQPKLETPAGQEGVDEILRELFSFGTKSLDRLAFQKELDDIGASESAGEDFSIRVLASQFERGVALLADHELHPALPESAFRIVRQQRADAVAGQLQSPDYLTDRALLTAIFPESDPVLRETNPKTIAAVTLDRVKEYFRNVYRPDLTTILVIGRITPENAKRIIVKYFGGWKATGPKPETQLPAVPPNIPSRAVVPDSSKVQDTVSLAETLGLVRSNPDYYALELGNHVLGGSFYATRLYRDLREKAGLVYFVSSSLEVGKTRAIYRVNFGCDPPNVSKVRAIVEGNLKKMQNTPVSPDELRQAKVLLLREIPLSESSVDRIASGLLSRSDQDLPLDEPIRAARRYLKLNAEDIRKAFTKWLRPDAMIEVTEGPNPQ